MVTHYHSHLVLQLCRILYTVFCESISAKQVSAEWVKNKFGSQWENLIEEAENWGYGKEMTKKEEAIAFIRFCIEEIKKSPLYQSELI